MSAYCFNPTPALDAEIVASLLLMYADPIKPATELRKVFSKPRIGVPRKAVREENEPAVTVLTQVTTLDLAPSPTSTSASTVDSTPTPEVSISKHRRSAAEHDSSEGLEWGASHNPSTSSMAAADGTNCFPPLLAGKGPTSGSVPSEDAAAGGAADIKDLERDLR
ncbi:hypothetical protein JCM11641_004961 [Rhodosporidiobolus odoratus]